MMTCLFIGDSLVQFNHWSSNLIDGEIINCGVAGETVDGLTAYLPVLNHRYPDPAMVMIMIGTNNLVSGDCFFLLSYQSLLEECRSSWPRATFVVTSLLPMPLSWLGETGVADLNRLLADLAEDEGAGYLDVYGDFVRAGQQGEVCFEDDGVHLTPVGYDVWSRVLARDLPALLVDKDPSPLADALL